MADSKIVTALGVDLQASLVTGRVMQLRAMSDIYERPGIDSHGVRTIGTRSEITPITVIAYKTSYANAKTFADSIRATIGTFVTVYYELTGYTDSNVYVVDVKPARGTEDIRAALEGASNTYMVELTMLVQKM